MTKLNHPWFEQWPESDSYRASDGTVNRIPLRLTSSNLIIYGSANLKEVLKEFEHEDHIPVTVSGEVPVRYGVITLLIPTVVQTKLLILILKHGIHFQLPPKELP